jgi:hypothetical protein
VTVIAATHTSCRNKKAGVHCFMMLLRINFWQDLFLHSEKMSIDGVKTARVFASSADGSDEEWQKSDQYKGEGTFEAGEGHHFYRPIDSYEGLHRWDPNFQWTEKEEKRIVRKVGYIPCHDLNCQSTKHG